MTTDTNMDLELVRCPGQCKLWLRFEPYSEGSDSIKLTGCNCSQVRQFEIDLKEIGLQELAGVTMYLCKAKSS